MDSKVKKDNFSNVLKIMLVIGIVIIIFSSGSNNIVRATPDGPDSIINFYNTTKTTVSPKMINISGGFIGTINISANVRDVRWKAFVGYVTGTFTLDDGSGASIFDWSLSSITGKVYATRNSTSVNWGNINCSNITTLNVENLNMNHTNANDNLTKTFNLTASATHATFYVGTRLITANSCPTLNTYVDNSTQDTVFEETALYDGYNIVYATNIEARIKGFDSRNYDFQMIVPENGLTGFSSATAYYIYVELGS